MSSGCASGLGLYGRHCANHLPRLYRGHTYIECRHLWLRTCMLPRGPRVPLWCKGYVRMRCLVPTRLAEAAIKRRGAALQLHAVAEWCRARGRRRRERPFASLLSVAAKALGLLARPRIAPGRARCHCGTYAVHERRSGGPRQARRGGAPRRPLARVRGAITDHLTACKLKP